MERTQIINPDWDFSKMGIGGLDTEFNAIFRSGLYSPFFIYVLFSYPRAWGYLLLALKFSSLTNFHSAYLDFEVKKFKTETDS
jgi:hypothetical protein